MTMVHAGKEWTTEMEWDLLSSTIETMGTRIEKWNVYSSHLYPLRMFINIFNEAI
jgi:hypothetical protein